MESLLKEMGLDVKGTIPKLQSAIAEHLAVSERPLIIDEVDHVIDKKNGGYLEVIRDIFESSQSAIILIGEEKLPAKLQQYERFHGRILDFVQALPVDFDDAKKLRDHYSPTVEISDDLLKKVLEAAKGSARRLCVNIAKIEEWANENGLQRVDTEDWGNQQFFTGQAPKIRRF